MNFVHLHTHSHYSLLNALPKIPELVSAAKQDGQTALALTDDGYLYGAIEFYKEATKQGVKPIIGVDLYMAPRSMHDKDFKIDKNPARLVLLAKNEEGYKNLIKIVTRAAVDGFFYVPRADLDLLKEFSSDVVAILPAHKGAHISHIQNQDQDKAKEIVLKYKEIFKDDLYLEITKHDEIPGRKQIQDAIVDLSRQTTIPLVATHDTYYLKKEHNFAREVLRCIKSGTTLLGDEQDRPDDFSFMSQGQIKKLFADLPEAVENANKIAQQCNLKLDLGNWIMPEFKIPPGESFDNLLRKKAYEGLKKRGVEETEETIKRLDYELDVIKTKGYSAYFLVVADIMEHAKHNHIYTNTRGSAAGSLVSYLIGITNANPLFYNLPFERFLNPERPSAPDIDMDIADDKRDALIDYVREKYGHDHVAQIGTFGTMAARASVRDVARALGHSYSVGDRIAKLIPFGAQGFTMTIDKALEQSPELAEAYEKDPVTREIIDIARQIEGNARHIGVHAAGVVISPKPLTEYVPLQPDPKQGEKLITQYDMYSIADEYGGVGLLKFDFLGLKNLTVLSDAIALVRKNHNKQIDVDKIPLDDPKTFKMLSEGFTKGVFQLSSEGMTRWLTELEPTDIFDINAMVALYRPGPMEFIPEYIKRKKNPSEVTYLDPRLEKILAPTYGILIYQDDVMMIAVELAGYSWGEADKFRKAMGKKIPEEMAAQETKFKTGCIERGMKKEAVEELWDQIKTFAAYGFNKSHSASYGNLAYKTAYMKANYPLEFMTALLTADAGEVDKIEEIISEAKKMGITILPPDVNESYSEFSVVSDKHAIRFGLMSIKNFGEQIAQAIVQEREANGPFKSLADFISRVGDKNLNKRAIEALIYSGALDSLDDRLAMMSSIDVILEFQKHKKNVHGGQKGLFDAIEEEKIYLQKKAEVYEVDKFAYEKELLGVYVSGHPMQVYRSKMPQVKDIKTIKSETKPGISVAVAGVVEAVHTILTKKQEKMAFVKISDEFDEIEAVFFPRIFETHQDKLKKHSAIVIKGTITNQNGKLSLQAEDMKVMKKM